MTAVATHKRNKIYEVKDNRLRLHFHEGQYRVWNSDKRFIAMLAGTQGGKTATGPWWLDREIRKRGGGDYIAATASFDLFKLKMLPELRDVFETTLGIGRYWAGSSRIMEIANPETGLFQAKQADDPMWARIILRSAGSKGGVESTTAKAAWLDEAGQDEFTLETWDAIRARLSLNLGRCLITTTLYNRGWLKQQVYDSWEQGHPDYDVIQFDSAVNPLFPKEEFEDRRRTMPTWKFNMRYRGMYDKPAGMIYNDFVDKLKEEGGHLVKRFDIPTEWPRWAGVDPGAVNHAIIWIAHDTDNDIYYVYREKLEGGKSTKEHAVGADKLAKDNKERIIIYAVGNKGEVQQRLDWKAAGVRNVKEPSISDVEGGIDKVIELLREFRIFFFDDLYTTLDQIGTYARVVDENGETTKVIKNKEKYHLLDALRYAVIALRRKKHFVL